MQLALFVVLALASFSASAQSVYKCVGKGRVASFQSEPCSVPDQVKKVWDATPEQLSNTEQWRRYNAQKKAASDAAYLRSLAQRGGGRPRTAGVGISSSNNGCDSAKRTRDAFYARTPKRTSKDMERWTNYVYEACK